MCEREDRWVYQLPHTSVLLFTCAQSQIWNLVGEMNTYYTYNKKISVWLWHTAQSTNLSWSSKWEDHQKDKQHHTSHTKYFLLHAMGNLSCIVLPGLYYETTYAHREAMFKKITSPSWRLGRTLWHCVGWALGAGGCRPLETKHGPRSECCFLITETQAHWAHVCSTFLNIF